MAESQREVLFYDGACGLCHRWVRRCLAADPQGRVFDFSPRGGATWDRLLSEAERADAPDSIGVRTKDGRLLFKAEAVGHIGERLGHDASVRWATWPMRRLPRWVADGLYSAVARVRHWVFARPAEACPVVPAEQRGRFLP
ncbi:MAG: DCC1-like thiol-disulfide oxidoreductase family protein [Planctomycetota bacterium]